MNNKPEKLENPDFSELIELCQQNLDEIEEQDEDDDTEHYIYEAAMEAVFGEDELGIYDKGYHDGRNNQIDKQLTRFKELVEEIQR